MWHADSPQHDDLPSSSSLYFFSLKLNHLILIYTYVYSSESFT